jgi:transposase
MNRPTHEEQCSASRSLFVALELSAKEWLVTVGAGLATRPRRARLRPGDGAALGRVLARARTQWGVAAETPVRSCYEAGRDGFWPHRWLTTLGIENRVVDSSSIEVSRRVRRAKTDRLDGEKLLRMLLRHWGGERGLWQVVHVPTREVEDARQASRTLTTLTAERTRYRNRIHALLALHGGQRVRIDARFPARLAAARAWDHAPLPPGVQARLLIDWRILQAIEAERQTARREERRRARGTDGAPPTEVQRLTQLRGVAARSATILADELFTRALRNRRQVGALTGLVSAPYASGQTRIDQGVVRSGLPAVRRVAVEIAWAWLRYQPTSALSGWYRTRFGGGGAARRRVGIVALARRVIIALWRYAERGVLPEGALLKS